jgi:hypothetical protein
MKVKIDEEIICSSAQEQKRSKQRHSGHSGMYLPGGWHHPKLP